MVRVGLFFFRFASIFFLPVREETRNSGFCVCLRWFAFRSGTMSGKRGASSRSKGVRKSAKGTSCKMASSLVPADREPAVICESDDEGDESDSEHGESPVFTEDYIRLQQQQYEPGQTKTLLLKAFRKTLATDVATINEAIRTASDAGVYQSQKPRFQEKLQWFADMLCNCEDVTAVVYDVAKTPQRVLSILPVARVLVHDPLAFNTKVRALVASEKSNLWKVGLYGPTFPIYSFFRKLGMKPRFRGLGSTDPGKDDMLYYHVWTFTNDAAFQPLVGI